MTIQELKEKYKEDNEAIKVIEDLEAKINFNYIEDNLKLKQENEKLKLNNELLYNQCLNGGKLKEEKQDDNPRFVDYTNDILDALKNK
jgi:hypothetical protein